MRRRGAPRLRLQLQLQLRLRPAQLARPLLCPPPGRRRPHPRCRPSLPQLSGGQRKRVALAASLLRRPDLLVLDEPTNHMDVEMISWMEAELAREDLAVVLVTHDRRAARWRRGWWRWRWRWRWRWVAAGEGGRHMPAAAGSSRGPPGPAACL
jgi:hypothetical protein